MLKLLSRGPRAFCHQGKLTVKHAVRCMSNLTKLEFLEDSSIVSTDEEKDRVSDLYDRYLPSSLLGHEVLLIQPFLKELKSQNRNMRLPLAVAESRALVSTLNWAVIDEVTIGLTSFNKSHLFGSGNLEMLREKVLTNSRISAVFISLYLLSPSQRSSLEHAFSVPVIDRYYLVLTIFHQHARSQEAKMQIRLAELPYIKHRLSSQHEHERLRKHSKGNLGEQYFQTQTFVLKQVESKIKQKLAAIKSQRFKLREERKKRELPTVAVIGYTNCGKTSLIKSITGANLEPKNQLFATLDVTCHSTRFQRSNMNVIFIDTVGFISDIPTGLIASFSSTLEDALDADLMLHVEDVSNPDIDHQKNQVLATLKRLRVGETSLSKMITVGNKIDLLPVESWLGVKKGGVLPISAKVGHGLQPLMNILEERLIKSTNRLKVKMRLRLGSDEWNWLLNRANIGSTEVCDKDMNYNIVDVVITTVEMEKFKSKFLKN